MRKLEVPFVAMALLCIDDDLHSDGITSRIVDSDLTVLAYRGETPERTVNSQLHNTYKRYFSRGSRRSHFQVADRVRALDEPEVRLAIFALLQQSPSSELNTSRIVEFTFIGNSLVAVRNAAGLLACGTPKTRKIMVPGLVSVEEAERHLSKRDVKL